MLLHEHIFIDSRGRYPVPTGLRQPTIEDTAPLTLETLAAARRTPWAFPSQVLQLNSVDNAVHELVAFRERCGGALVCDATPCDEGRDPAKLRRAALQSGVLVVMGASVARASLLPGNGDSDQATLISDVAAALEVELRVGVEVPSASCPMVESSGDNAAGTMRVQAGFIGELSIGQGAAFELAAAAAASPTPMPPGAASSPSPPPLLLEATLVPADVMYLAGAARAQAATGCLILLRVCPGGARGALRCDPLAAKPHAIAALARAAVAIVAANGGNLARVAIAGVDELLLALVAATGGKRLNIDRGAAAVEGLIETEAADARRTLQALRLAGVSVVAGGFGRSLALCLDALSPDAVNSPLPPSDESLARGLAAFLVLPKTPPPAPPPESPTEATQRAPLGLVLAGHGAHTKLETLRGGGGGLSHVSSWPQGAVAVRLRRAAAMLIADANGSSGLGVAHATTGATIGAEGSSAAVSTAETASSSLGESELCAVLRGGRLAAQLLAWWTPVVAPPAPLATSRCSWCAKGFVYVESEHFSKFNFEYCRAKCLRAHREAGFPDPAQPAQK